jgi:spore coat protein CotH
MHSFDITVDPQDLAAMLSTFTSTGDKKWIEATVVIDGQTFTNVGLKLKGNSSLRNVETTSDPATLPWLVRLDRYVDGQSLDGSTDFVVRGNTSETSLNEAVALAMLSATGLATEEYAYAEVSVNGSGQQLRLVVENPSDEFMERTLGDGYLYKAEAGGDYSYRGDSADDYADVFDQEGGTEDFTPLAEFLKFVNDSDDATFASELADRLDVDAFATYLAFQNIVRNNDDIDGPGNNSYLYYDPETGKMTVVNWDLNLALGGTNGMGGGRPGGGGAGAGRGADQDGGGQRPAGGRGGNILSERFLANAEFKALYESKVTALKSQLAASGTEALSELTTLLKENSSLDESTIDEESAAISQYLAS